MFMLVVQNVLPNAYYVRHGASIHESTGPPHKTPLQLAAAGGHLEVC